MGWRSFHCRYRVRDCNAAIFVALAAAFTEEVVHFSMILFDPYDAGSELKLTVKLEKPN
jgi:hypothetical protein